MDDTDADMDATNVGVKQDSRFSCNICLEPVTEPVVTRCGHLFCWPCLYRWLEPGIRPEEALASWPNFYSQGERVVESRRCCPVCKATCSVPTLVPIYVRETPGTPLSSSTTRKTAATAVEENDGEEEKEEETTEQEETSSVASIHEQEAEEVEDASTTFPENTTGLRQRLRFRSRDSEIPEIPLDDVPSRPAASPARTSSAIVETPRHTQPQQQAAAAFPARPPLSPHQASLSHGMLLMFQQALSSTEQTNQQQRGVPPLHQTGDDNEFHHARGTDVESPRDDATEFLSRLILILASFVILCLLLF